MSRFLTLILTLIPLFGCNGSTLDGASAGVLTIGQDDQNKELPTGTFYAHGVVDMDCVVQGHQVHGVVDTGSSYTTVNESLQAFLPSPIQNRGRLRFHISSKLVSEYDDIVVSYGRFAPEKRTVFAVDLAAAEEVVGQKLGIVIGMDLIERHILVLDGSPDSLFRVLPEKYANRTATGFSISNENRPMVPIKLPILGVRDFLVDTGFNRCLTVTEAVAGSMLRSGVAVSGASTVSVTVVGNMPRSTVIIREVDVLGTRLSNVPASVKDINSIGIELLLRFAPAFDFPNKTLYHLEGSQVSTAPFWFNLSGVAFAFRSPESLYVLEVFANSPGEQAGLKKGDEILSLNGKDPSSLTRAGIDAIVSQEGQIISVSGTRGGKPYDAQIELKHQSEFPPKWKPLTSDDSEFDAFLEAQPAEQLR